MGYLRYVGKPAWSFLATPEVRGLPGVAVGPAGLTLFEEENESEYLLF